VYLAEAERLSHTGTLGWNASTGEVYWSEGTYRVFECDPAVKPTVQMVIDRCHPDDRMRLQQTIDRAVTEGSEFIIEHRVLMVDGSVKHVRAVAHRLSGGVPGNVIFVGAITDVTERKRAEEERERLRQLEADLAYMNRVSMMGELAASLAHEIKQPIAAARMDANACMRWLRCDPPDMMEACSAASRLVADVTRAAGIIDRVHSLYGRGTPEREVVDLNEILREMTVVLGDTADRHAISIRMDLDLELPRTSADRVQLQQVLMNLMLNGIEAMREMGGELTVASKRIEHGQLLISVRDSGVGLPGNDAERIFEAFFTTKPHGTGMGLCISRRVIESHGGRLWATPNAGSGARRGGGRLAAGRLTRRQQRIVAYARGTVRYPSARQQTGSHRSDLLNAIAAVPPLLGRIHARVDRTYSRARRTLRRFAEHPRKLRQADNA
jgi:signal transduction histidine kinase